VDNPYAPPSALVEDIVAPDAELVPASRSSRLWAALIDGVIFSALVYLPVLLGLGLASGMGSEGSGMALLLFLPSCVGFAVWAYFTLKFVRANGQSIAKRWFGIKVVRRDGSPVSLGRIFWLRNVVNSALSGIPLVGWVYALADAATIFEESRRCLHDRLADTIVVVA